MNLGATAAQSLWAATSVAPALRFAQALGRPEATQTAWLAAALRRDAASAFGRAHDFRALRDYRDFARRVPLATYADVAPWIDRVMRGEVGVLGSECVTRLVPTSGTMGAQKLIPFTSSLQRSFSRAVGAWLVDLVRVRPRLLLGPSYWAISPALELRGPQMSAVPVGFADDAEYLSPWSARLARYALAAPSLLSNVRQIESWKAVTLLCLLRARDLRLISIWHPSYLDAVCDDVHALWPTLLEAVGCGRNPWLPELRFSPNARRAQELRRIGPENTRRWWPHLQVISCWGEQAAAAGFDRLRAAFPEALVQAKGLLATEAVVTVPWQERHVLAVTSHFFEFLREDGSMLRCHELTRGQAYEVVVSNGGGLWRYRLGDLVECTGCVGATPTLRFLGRVGNVSDLRGEKLSEAFVAEVLTSLWPSGGRPAVAELHASALAPDGSDVPHYELRVSNSEPLDLAVRLDAALSCNPHYAWARKLGQIGAATVASIDSVQAVEFSRIGCTAGQAKPRVLVRMSSR